MHVFSLGIAWKDSTEKEKKGIIQDCIEHLEFIQEELRLNAAKILVYISLGKMLV